MMGRSHMAIGAAWVAPAAVHLARAPAGEEFLWAGVGAVAALAPDLDHHASTLGRMLPRWWHRATPGHRGMTHSLAWVLALGLVAGLLGVLVGATARVAGTFALVTTVGALSHLVADGVTRQGVPWLWPWRRERYVLPWSLRTAGAGEAAVVALVVVVALLLV